MEQNMLLANEQITDGQAQNAPDHSTTRNKSEKQLPLPGWLTKVYFIFPVVLYIPDALFNYYVYSDGITQRSANPLIQAGFVALWAFLSVGVVGMAYLLSVLAPWHWGQGHRIQAIFCGFGVLIATGITTWNSLSYRSNQFIAFRTDQWADVVWPQLAANHISVTMILVSIAPPFWGLFWAIVQPTQTGRSLRQLQESHEERLMRLQQEAELKKLRAQTNATIREAQVRGMAQTAATVREQAGGVLAQRRNKGAAQVAQVLAQTEQPATASGTTRTSDATPDMTDNGSSVPGAITVDAEAAVGGRTDVAPAEVFHYPTYTPNAGGESNRSTLTPNQTASVIGVASGPISTALEQRTSGVGGSVKRKNAQANTPTSVAVHSTVENGAIPGSPAFRRRVREKVDDLRSHGQGWTSQAVAQSLGVSPDLPQFRKEYNIYREELRDQER